MRVLPRRSKLVLHLLLLVRHLLLLLVVHVLLLRMHLRMVTLLLRLHLRQQRSSRHLLRWLWLLQRRWLVLAAWSAPKKCVQGSSTVLRL